METCFIIEVKGSEINLSEDGQVSFEFSWGLGGSGSHKSYNQVSKTAYSPKQVISVCFSLRELTLSQGNKSVNWLTDFKTVV